ncbi:MAG: YfjI family protein [Nitrospiraceae bacterium]|nr:YfjI family protein [Nitrospiraceae bacterium]
MVKRIGEVNQVDVGLAGSIYLACLATAVSKKAEIDLLSHREPLNIFTVSVLDSGNRKSTTVSSMTAPLYEYQRLRQEELKEDIRVAANANKIREQRLAKAQRDAANLAKADDRRIAEIEAANILRDMDENPVPKLPVFLADDITPEKLADLMADNGERIAIISPEGTIFGIAAGRYNDSKGGNFDIFLKSHAGDACSIHRIGREAKTMQSPSLVMCLAVQSDVIAEIGANRQFRGRGLLARFLYTLCPSQIGNRKRQISFIPDTLLKAYRAHLFALLDIPRTDTRIQLSFEGQRVWDEFYWDIEQSMRDGGCLAYLRDWGSKLPGAVARIAGLLHLAENGARALEMPISVSCVTASCVLGAYYKDHALAVFGLMETDPATEAAKKVLAYLKRVGARSFQGRDVIWHTNLKKMTEVEPGLRSLVERGYIREMERVPSTGGRPKAQSYAVNPGVLLLETRNESNKRP